MSIIPIALVVAIVLYLLVEGIATREAPASEDRRYRGYGPGKDF